MSYKNCKFLCIIEGVAYCDYFLSDSNNGLCMPERCPKHKYARKRGRGL